jgi:hypothetical protein
MPPSSEDVIFEEIQCGLVRKSSDNNRKFLKNLLKIITKYCKILLSNLSRQFNENFEGTFIQ